MSNFRKIDPALNWMKKFSKLSPQTTSHIHAMREETLLSDGILPARLKVLMAALWGISARCEPCLKFYIKKAKALGATEEEVGEVLSIAATMGGCVGEMWALKAYKAYMEEESEPTGRAPNKIPECCDI